MSKGQKTKTQKVLEYLQEKGSITPREALEKFNSYRLSSIIFNLKERYNILTVMEYNEDKSVRWARYIYKGEKEIA